MWRKPDYFLLHHLVRLFVFVREKIALLLIVDVLEIEVWYVHLLLWGDVLIFVLHHFDLLRV